MTTKIKRAMKPVVHDGVVLCGKKAQGDIVTLWVLSNPNIRAEAKNLEQAEERLLDTIWSTCQLDEPVALKYENGNQKNPASKDNLLWIGPNITIDTTDSGQYFNDGFCPTCQTGKGGRNTRFLELDGVPKTVKAGLIVRFQPYFKCGLRVGMTILHTSICEIMTRECNPLIEFRPVKDKKRGFTDFREVIPTRFFPSSSPVGKKRPGGKCVECGSICLYGDVGKVFLKKDEADVIRQHGAAAIGSSSRPDICVSTSIWQSLQKVAAARGLLQHCSIIELNDMDIQGKPKLEKIIPFKV